MAKRFRFVRKRNESRSGRFNSSETRFLKELNCCVNRNDYKQFNAEAVATAKKMEKQLLIRSPAKLGLKPL